LRSGLFITSMNSRVWRARNRYDAEQNTLAAG